MWDVEIVARQRHEDQLRRAGHRRRVAEAKAATAARRVARTAGVPAETFAHANAALASAQASASPAGHRGEAAPTRVRARRALGFALVQAGLWVLVGPRRRQPVEHIEQLAWHPERETARASESHRS